MEDWGSRANGICSEPCLTQDLEVGGVERVCSIGDTRSAHKNLAEKRPHGKLQRSQEMNGTNSQSCPITGFGIEALNVCWTRGINAYKIMNVCWTKGINAYKITVGKPSGKRALGKPTRSEMDTASFCCPYLVKVPLMEVC